MISLLTEASDVDGDPLSVIGGLARASDARGIIGFATIIGDEAQIVPSLFDDLGAGDTAIVEIEYAVFDGALSTNALARFTILGANDLPELVVDETVDVAENETIVATISATDADGDAVSFVLVDGGADNALFAVDAVTGELSFINAPDFEAPFGGDNTYEVRVGAFDGTGTTASDIVVTVTDVDEGSAPEVVAIDQTVTEDDAVLTLDLLTGATDADDDPLSISGAIVVASDGRDLTGIATVSGTDLQLDPGGFGDLGDGDSVDVTVTFGVFDGTNTTPNSAIITIDGINDAPVAAPIERRVTEEDAAFTADLLETATDVEDDPLSVTGALALASDGRDLTGIVSISGDQVSVAPSAFDDLGGGDAVAITVSYGVFDGDLTTPNTAVFTIDGINDAPVIEAPASVDVLENQTAVADIGGTDVDSTDLTYAIVGGADGGLFAIDPASGVLTFIEAPDFEIPGDSDGDNTYEVEVELSDGLLAADTLIFVNVGDVDEQPALNPVFGTEGSDRRLTGTNGDDIINSLGGRSDRMTGLDGADVFDFSTSSADGDRGTRTITDFDATEGDVILLAAGVSVLAVREVRDDTRLYLDGDRDIITLSDVSDFDTDSLLYDT